VSNKWKAVEKADLLNLIFRR